MDNNDLKKKKECIKMLVEDDIAIYNQFLPKIEKMTDEEIENLFAGNCKYFESESNNQFKMLVYKFQNFSILLFQWYNKTETMKYLKELWENYICFEDLRNLNQEQLETFMNGKTTYKNWPTNIKNEYKMCIRNTKDTIISELKNSFENLSEFEKNLYNSLEDLIKTNGEEYPGIKKASEKYEYEILKNSSKEVRKISFETFMQFKNVIIPPSMENWAFSEKLKSMTDSCNNYIHSNYQENLNLYNIVDGVFGLIDFVFGIEDFNSICKEVEKFKEFKDILEKIIQDFNSNKDAILNSEELFTYSLEKMKIEIQSGIEKIKGNLSDLNNLILYIENAIEKAEKGRNTSFISSLASFVSLGLSMNNMMFMTNNKYDLFCVGMHSASCVINAINVVKYVNLIKDLKNLLEEAKEKRKKMLDDINIVKNFIKKKLTIINEGIPKYY